MIIYAISGLGADERAFAKLKLKHPLKHISWKSPEGDESLSSYANRMAEEIDSSEEFILLGLSFGGIVAIEIAKIKQPIKTILISSAPTKAEIPASMRLMGRTGFIRAVPPSRLTPPPFISNWFFGVEDEEAKKLLEDFVQNTDPLFLKWAIKQIMCWENEEELPCLCIHGTNDRLIPCHDKAIKIDKGTHFMILAHAERVTSIINEHI